MRFPTVRSAAQVTAALSLLTVGAAPVFAAPVNAQAEFEAHAQMPTAASVFTAEIPDPAWKKKPSWYMVAKGDKIINPDLERMYAVRAHAHRVEIDGASHSVYESHPKDVAALIELAARQSDQ